MSLFIRLFVFLLICLINTGLSAVMEEVPVQYEGRIRPLRAVLALTGKSRAPINQVYDTIKEPNSSIKLLLPKHIGENWLPLIALENKIESTKFTGNITGYSDDQFIKLRQDFILVKQENDTIIWEQIAENLIESYQTAQLHDPTLPSYSRVLIESAYYQYPLIEATLLAYLFGLIAVSLALSLNAPFAGRLGTYLLLTAFFLHTILIAMRCYILWRPPVSNMDETLLFIPWVAVLTMGIFWIIFRDLRLFIAGALAAFALLTIALIKGMDTGLENTQAVLNSHYWLTVHVLMIVGSYGVFFVNALLAHYYLIRFLIKNDSSSDRLSSLILQTMYVGVGLLIPGTILGGVWAAESWGRFWDWDPKESWAFISICVYLLVVHAYRFKKIAEIGLSVGAILGFQAITFTWYGVNYILGTGLHSYGFGSGGTGYYFFFTLIEAALMMSVLTRSKKL